MSIGLCCQYLAVKRNRKGDDSYYNIFSERHLQLGRFRSGKYTNSEIYNVYVSNLDNLHKALQVVSNDGYKSVRLSSNIFPLIDKVQPSIYNDSAILKKLASIGEFVTRNEIRITTHPGQFNVLSSDSSSVVENSVSDLRFHAWVFDRMNLPRSPYYAINIHGGKKDRIHNLVNAVNGLDEAIKSRLTLENCEIAYTVSDLIRVHKLTGVPICFDSHHHELNSGSMPHYDAFMRACDSWNGIKPLQHLSNSFPKFTYATKQKRRKHSDYVHYIPEMQYNALKKNEIDVDFEFKMKNIAIDRATKEFDLKK